MSGPATVREGVAADVAFIVELGTATLRTSVPSAREPVADATLARSFSHLLATVGTIEHAVYVAEEDGERVGFCIVADDLPDEVTELSQSFVAYMAVVPAARGRGIAGRLIAAAEDGARARGRRYLALMVTEENAAARRAYDRAGYRTERRYLCKTLA